MTHNAHKVVRLSKTNVITLSRLKFKSENTFSAYYVAKKVFGREIDRIMNLTMIER